jgi:hypothetical protein
VGRLRCARDPDGGYVLVDIMIALIITGVAAVVLFGAISICTRNAGRIRERLDKYIARQNEHAETRTIEFVKE